MKVEWRTYAGLAAFVLPIGLVYVVLSREPVGSVLLFACALSLAALAVYLWWSRRGEPQRPEDMADADEARAAVERDGVHGGPVEVGEFPIGSVWPLFMGLACLGIAWGLAFTAWITLPSAVALLVAVIGYAHEVETGGADPVQSRSDAVGSGARGSEAPGSGSTVSDPDDGDSVS